MEKDVKAAMARITDVKFADKLTSIEQAVKELSDLGDLMKEL